MLLIDDIFLIGALILAVGCGIAFILKAKPFQILFWSLAFIYAIIVLGLTLFPIPYQQTENFLPVPHNLVPFRTIGSLVKAGATTTTLMQIGGNILISAPYGLLLYLLVSQKKKAPLLLLSLLFPLVIESLQLAIGLLIGLTYRSFDIDDFILNVSGAYLGIAFGKIFLKNRRAGIRRKLFPNKP